MLKDRFGQAAFVGCTIAYPVKLSTSAVIRTGIVEKIVPATKERRSHVHLVGGTRGGFIFSGGRHMRPLRRRVVYWSDDVIVLGGGS